MNLRTGFAATIVAVLVLGFAAACGDDDATVTQSPTQSTSSPASGTLAAANLPIPNPWELHVAAADGSVDKLLYASDLGLSYAWSPDGQTLAVTESNGMSTSIRFLDLDGHERASAEHGGYSGELNWSPDGRYLVATFTGATSGNTAVVALPADGSGQKELLSSSSPLYPTISGWLPEGELLLLKGNGSSGLFAYDIDAGTSRALSDLPVIADFFGKPAISPDETKLAVFSAAEAVAPCEGGSVTAAFTIDIETGASTRVTPEIQCASGGIVWSPDGTMLAFSTLAIADTAGLFTVDIASGQTQRLTTGLDNVVAWLNDGTILAQKYFCVQCDGGPPSLLAIDSETGDVRDLAGHVQSSVSPGGKIVVADGALKTLDEKGATIATIAQVEAGWQYYSLTWAPGEKYVAYTRSRGQGEHFFQVGADGSGFQWLGSHDGTAKLAPDGKRLAYLIYAGTADGKSFATLWLAEADASHATQVAVEGSVGNYSWSPDSSRIAFEASDVPGSVGSLYLANADGDGVHVIGGDALSLETKSSAPMWSPNGKLVTFGGGGNAVLDIESGAVTEVGPTGGKGYAQWAGDSAHVLYADGTTKYIESVPIDGGESTRITPAGDRMIAGVAESPDGSRIAFVSMLPSSKTSQVHVMNSDGSDDTLVLEGDSVSGAPVWSPDGSSFAVNAADGGAYGLFVVPADGSSHEQLTRGSSIDTIIWRDNDTLQFSTFVGGL